MFLQYGRKFKHLEDIKVNYMQIFDLDRLIAFQHAPNAIKVPYESFFSHLYKIQVFFRIRKVEEILKRSAGVGTQHMPRTIVLRETMGCLDKEARYLS